MEGNGIGHTASSSNHSIFMHSPGMPVVAPMTPNEYERVWDYFVNNDDPIYVSEHRKSFSLDEEMQDTIQDDADITIIAISAARLNVIEAEKKMRHDGIKCNIFHLLWLKPFAPNPEMLDSLKRTKIGLVLDSDYEISGASRSLAFELMHLTGARVYALGLEDRACGAAKNLENITPSPEKILTTVKKYLH